MLPFGFRFFICNIFIAIMIGMILIAKWLFKKQMTSRMQYNIWFVMLAMLAVPFLPGKPVGWMQIISWIADQGLTARSAGAVSQAAPIPLQPDTADWMNDFGISVSQATPSAINILLLSIWVAGILSMAILALRSTARLHRLKQSALPLQSQTVRALYDECIEEMKLKRPIPVYSAAYLTSPVMGGIFTPRIYLPIHLISDYNAAGMRYMLLHELQHYRHRDALINGLMNLAGIVYWFNPLVWYALKEMRNDQEVACDTSVLTMLRENDYEDYGNTLIDFAEKVSLTPFPFAAGIGGSMNQMKRRILNIASYETPTLGRKVKGLSAFIMTALLLSGFAPALSLHADSEDYYRWKHADEPVSYTDFSSCFQGYEGSFVLYESRNHTWNIYNKDAAVTRTSPNSTYKIYMALTALEAGVITPDQSGMSWNREAYPFESWNADQELQSAMQSSVNWYFQTLNEQAGPHIVTKYLNQMGYGNQDMSGGFSSYWMESSLKISPVEQVELLRKLYKNDFGFDQANIQAVKDSIRLSASSKGTLFGKTGTGRVNGGVTNGWFTGYAEVSGHTYFFATNIQSGQNATGTTATEITLSILSELNIYEGNN